MTLEGQGHASSGYGQSQIFSHADDNNNDDSTCSTESITVSQLFLLQKTAKLKNGDSIHS